MNTSVESITTASVEEGLDFACSLASDAIARAGETDAQQAQELLRGLASYVRFRYVSEFGLALEELASLGRRCDANSFRAPLFWRQLHWVASEMKLTGEALARVQLHHG